jgi:DNA repair and recombination protein RAD54 and RAD54-like protein
VSRASFQRVCHVSHVTDVTRRVCFDVSFAAMLRRIPITNDGMVVDRFQESNRVSKPFKAPTVAAKPVERSLPQRKRKRVSYKENNENDSDESDDGRRYKKKKPSKDVAYVEDGEVVNINRSFPIFKPKPFGKIFGAKFAVPEIRNKSGEIVAVVLSNVSLGIRAQAAIPPRPLHDPMQDHAIVLYDPTIDERETDEERKERIKEEERERATKDAIEKNKGLFNPHKSLRALLGEGKQKDRMLSKVPVVIDPRLSKVLRPHQVEGVKVSRLAGMLIAC